MKRERLPAMAAKTCLILLLVAGLLVWVGNKPAGAADKIKLTLDTGLTQSHEQTWAGTGKPWTEGVSDRTGGDVVFDSHFGGLVSMIDLIKGAGTGIIDIGAPFLGYYPSEFAMEATLGTLTHPEFTLGDPELIAITRVLYADVPAFSEAYRKSGVKKLFTIACPGWGVVSRVPVLTLEDFKGVKIRTFGTYIPKMMRAAGAVPVTVPFSDVLDAIHKKVADGTFVNISNARDIKLHEVAPHVVQLGPKNIPPHVVPYSYVMNLKTWNKLPQQIKRIMMEEGKRVEMEYAFHSLREQSIAAKQMEKAGATLHMLSDKDLKEWAKRCGDLEGTAAKALDDKGLPGTETMALIKKLAQLPLTELMVKFYNAWEKELALVK